MFMGHGEGVGLERKVWSGQNRGKRIGVAWWKRVGQSRNPDPHSNFTTSLVALGDSRSTSLVSTSLCE